MELTAGPEPLTLVGGPIFLLYSFLEGRLRPPWRTPHFQLDVVIVVESMVKQYGGQVDVRVMTSKESPETVLTKILDPFGTNAKVKLRIRATETCPGN